MDSNVSGPKCGCVSACPPCMGRCDCFFQKTSWTETAAMTIPVALIIIVVIGFMVIRRKIASIFSENPTSL